MTKETVTDLNEKRAPHHERLILTSLMQEDKEYIEIEREMEATIRTHQGNNGGVLKSYEVIKIQQIDNDHLIKIFNERK